MKRNDYGYPLFDAPLLDAGIAERETEPFLWAVTGWLSFTLAVLLIVAGFAWRDEHSQRLAMEHATNVLLSSDPCTQPVQVKQ